eukprot:CAMPEP_0204353944 /NCGR_PEP_ID=MMETSP0469-20131031/33040_1 /ASSEMBLY_ACC=CAM_ASM_000384 /TAXON_ID=2969 /ORGANISM="Oxyrrhis marina" /LENGTH=76 /DNA_ID=CAMNT_0051340939 /DNA_START=9 /DNA_END=235 /DNA_ORIENTATION=-
MPSRKKYNPAVSPSQSYQTPAPCWGGEANSVFIATLLRCGGGGKMGLGRHPTVPWGAGQTGSLSPHYPAMGGGANG